MKKLLSEDPSHYKDAPTEGIRRILFEESTNHCSSRGKSYEKGAVIDTHDIEYIRMGTTGKAIGKYYTV